MEVGVFGRVTHIAVTVGACLMVTACGIQIQQHPASVPFHVDWATPSIPVQVIGSAPAPKGTAKQVNSVQLAAMSQSIAMVGAKMSGHGSKTMQTKFETISHQATSIGLGIPPSTTVTMEQTNGGFDPSILQNMNLSNMFTKIAGFLP